MGGHLHLNRKDFAKDFLASLVVFLVALPLCMGIAIASGASPVTGLTTGIIGGLVVGFIAGSPFQVSGPAAGLAVIVYELIQTHGIGMLGPIVLLAGAIQLVAGLCKAGQLFRAISPAVIYGMLAGIGVLIFAGQFHVMMDDKPKGTGLLNLISIPEAIYKGLWPLDGSTHHLAAFLGVLTITILLAWNKFAPAQLKLIPGAVVAVAVATALAGMWKLPVQYIQIPDNLWEAIQWSTPDNLAGLWNSDLLFAAFTLAFVASAESLLCATAVDHMHDGPRTNYDREMVAQGVGNLLCGAVGGLPMTGVIVRSSANVVAGAKTRLSAVLHGGWLLVFVAAVPFVLNLVPTSSLAALLVYTGYKLVNPANIRRLLKYGHLPLAVYAVTVIVIVVTNLLTGILVGLGLSIVKLLYAFSHMGIRIEKQKSVNHVEVHLYGSATFVRLPKLADALEQIPGSAAVDIHFHDLDYIDHACLEVLSSWEQQQVKKGGKVSVEWDALMQKFHQTNSLQPMAAQKADRSQ
ncbi:MAG: SulP family inorganic anion transporter [Acidobacteriia bacterium]|nr:SulP family inorganic anion transporter [Terriglobia bacterium]